MKKLLRMAIVPVALVVAGHTARGADIAPIVPTYVSPLPVFSYWTGPYIGVHGGWGWTTTQNIDAKGVFGGAQVGYNYQMGNLVFGVEGDGAFANINESFTGAAFGNAVSTATFKDDALASLRARFGFAVTQTLFYATAGGAWGRTEFSGTTLSGVTVSGRSWESGWAAGAGIEYAFGPNWSMKLEYLHYGLGGTNVSGVSTPGNLSVETVKVGTSYLFH